MRIINRTASSPKQFQVSAQGQLDTIIADSKKHWIWLGISYAMPMIIVWGMYLLAYWPGAMSPDSIDQWGQMLKFRFDDWHPVFHTLTNWLITRIWLSPAAVVLIQILALAFIMAWGLVELRRHGAHSWIPWIAILILIVMPSTALMVIVLWKDVFFTIAITALTILVFKITMTEGRWVEQPMAWVYLGIISALVALYRHNGVLVLVTLPCLLIAYPKAWVRISAAFILALILWAVIRGPVYGLLGVNKAGQPGIQVAFIRLFARYKNSETPLLLQEQSLLWEILHEKTWPYDCYTLAGLYDMPIDWQGLGNHTSDLFMLSAKLILRNPKVFLDHIACNGALVFQITTPPGSDYETGYTGIVSNDLGLALNSRLPRLKAFLDKWIAKTHQYGEWIVWRVPFWNYLLLVGILVYSLRWKNLRIVLVVVPSLLNLLPMAFLAPVQALRYVYPTLLVSVLMSGFLISANNKVKRWH